MEPSLLNDVVAEVEADDFAQQQHRDLFKLIKSWVAKGRHVDAVMVVDHIRTTGTPRNLDIMYVISLPECCGATATVPYHAKNVRETGIRRRMVEASTALQNNASDTNLEIDELIEQGQRELLEIAGRQRGDEWFEGPQLVERAQDRWEHLVEMKMNGQVAALSTGLVAVDNVLSGLHPGLNLLAARPSMGKTAMALNITMSALQNNVPVAFFSLEMSADQLVDRMASALARVSAWNIKTGSLKSEEWARLENEALEFLHDAPLFVSDKAGVSISKISAQARRLKSKEPNLGLIVIDYLQLIRQPKAESMEQAVSQVSSTLKVISRDLNVPVLCLAQLNRGCEQRANKRPMLSDLRGSGSLEQDADVVMFLYRHAYYDDRADPTDAEVIISKHRSGPTGSVNVTWDANNQKFQDKNTGPKFSLVKTALRTRRDIDDDDSEPSWL
jgi:replicative DNA helicase